LEKFSRTDDELVPGTHRLTLNKDNDYMLDREMQRKVNFTGIPLQPVRMGRGQDGAMTESMGSVVDRTREHLGTSDSAIIAVRRSLLQEVRDFQEGVEPHAATNPAVYRVRSGSAVLAHDVPFDEGEQAQAEGFVLA
jgi:phthalate 4,5-dioxygenase oxygenase subunit